MATATEALPAKRKKAETQISLPGTLKTTSLDLPAGLSYERWEYAGKVLASFRVASQWAIGDWLRYGEHTYSEKYSQAADITGMNPDSLTVYQWVADRVPKEIRREDLSHAHHQVVARLEVDEMQAWLDRAAKKGWSVADLKSKLREKRAKEAKKTGDTEKAPKFKVVLHFVDDPGEEDLERLENYVRKMGGELISAKW